MAYALMTLGLRYSNIQELYVRLAAILSSIWENAEISDAYMKISIYVVIIFLCL